MVSNWGRGLLDSVYWSKCIWSKKIFKGKILGWDYDLLP